MELVAKVQKPNMQESDVGLVMFGVDSSTMGAGWFMSQKLEDGKEYVVTYGSCTFNEVESRYSQPKLELYGVYRALRAERRNLWGIHFRLKVDASALVKMINAPEIPSAGMNRWLSYIQMFDAGVYHVPAMQHRGPDGLSR